MLSVEGSTRSCSLYVGMDFAEPLQQSTMSAIVEIVESLHQEESSYMEHLCERSQVNEWSCYYRQSQAIESLSTISSSEMIVYHVLATQKEVNATCNSFHIVQTFLPECCKDSVCPPEVRESKFSPSQTSRRPAHTLFLRSGCNPHVNLLWVVEGSLGGVTDSWRRFYNLDSPHLLGCAVKCVVLGQSRGEG